MPLGGALAMGVGSIGSSILGAGAAKSAANAQVQAEQNAINTEQNIYNQNVGYLNPFRTTGQSALDTIGAMYGLANGGTGASNTQNFQNFTSSPGYQFSLNQGTQAVNASAAAQGQALSGANQLALQSFGSGLASTQFNNYVAQLMQLGGVGLNAAGMTANAGTNFANSVASLQTAQGASQASGIVGQSNALAGGLTGGLGSLGIYSSLGGGAGASSYTGNLGSSMLSNIGQAFNPTFGQAGGWSGI